MGMTNALNLLCGLALFLYGMHVMGEMMQFRGR